jgi:hypothetical protein
MDESRSLPDAAPPMDRSSICILARNALNSAHPDNKMTPTITITICHATTSLAFRFEQSKDSILLPPYVRSEGKYKEHILSISGASS